MPERLNGAVSKTVKGRLVLRGFESHPLRFASAPAIRWRRGRESLESSATSAATLHPGYGTYSAVSSSLSLRAARSS